MILKIQRKALNREWLIIDNIWRISIYSREEMTRVKLEEKLKDHNYNFMCMDEMVVSTNEVPYSNTDILCLKVISFKLVNDKEDNEYFVAFDTVAYLCNDEGKTIDKITV